MSRCPQGGGRRGSLPCPLCISSFPLSPGSSQPFVMFRLLFPVLSFPCRALLLCLPSVPCTLAPREHSCPLCHPCSFSRPSILASGAPHAQLLPCPPWALLCCSLFHLPFHCVPHQAAVLSLPILCRSALPVNHPPPQGIVCHSWQHARNFLCRCIFCGSEPQSKKITPDISTCMFNRSLKPSISGADLVDLSLRAFQTVLLVEKPH